MRWQARDKHNSGGNAPLQPSKLLGFFDISYCWSEGEKMSLWLGFPLKNVDEKWKSATFLSMAIITGDQKF